MAGDRLLVYKVDTAEIGFTTEARDITGVGWAGDLLLSAHEDGRIRGWRGGRAPELSAAVFDGPILDLATSVQDAMAE